MPPSTLLDIREISEEPFPVFVARQPIFDERLEVVGYEMLFRSGMENCFPKGVSLDFASAKTLLDTFILIGVDVLTGGKKAFLNFTRKMLLSEAVTLFPRDRLVVEILEHVEPEPVIIEVCQRLRAAGYQLALDDFVYREDYRPLLEMADMIKVDIRMTTPEEREEIIRRTLTRNMKYLAEKVETREEYDLARKQGFSFFQGYFFSRPVILAGRDIPAHKLNYLRLLQEANRPNPDYTKMEQVIRGDVSLTYKLLRFVNSAAFSLSRRVESVRHALVMLGEREIRKWVSLVSLSGLGKDKTRELFTSSLVRALFCELLAPQAGLEPQRSDLFLMGMLSLLDAFLDRPMEQLMNDLPIADDIKTALTGGQNRFREVYDLILTYERGDWAYLTERSAALGLGEGVIPNLFLQSVDLANRLFQEKMS